MISQCFNTTLHAIAMLVYVPYACGTGTSVSVSLSVQCYSGVVLFLRAASQPTVVPQRGSGGVRPPRPPQHSGTNSTLSRSADGPSVGTTRVWPARRGLISRNAYQPSPAATLLDGMAPWMILVKSVGIVCLRARRQRRASPSRAATATSTCKSVALVDFTL